MPTPSSPTLVLTGSYTPDTGGKGIGLAVVRFDPQTGRFIPDDAWKVPVSGASFLATHPTLNVVYSTNETDTGRVTAVAWQRDGSLTPLGTRVDSGGSRPCHVTVHPDGRWLLTAHYGSTTAPGSVAVHRLEEDGRVGELTGIAVHNGSGPVTGRQEGSHAHQVVMDPQGRFILVTDLGADAVFTYRLDTRTGTLQQIALNALRAGSGPRHLAFAPEAGLVFSTDELSSTLTCHRYHARTGTLFALSTVPSTAVDVPNAPGGIVASPDGRFVWVTNRGADTVAAFRISGTELQPIAEVPSGGAWPRSLSLAGGHLLVANQHSGTLTALRVLDTGALEEPGPAALVPSVTCAVVLGQ